MLKLTGALRLLLIFSFPLAFSIGCSHFGHHGHNCGESHCSSCKKDCCKTGGGCKDGSCDEKEEKKEVKKEEQK